MASSARVSTRLIIENDMLKTPWMPETQDVEGMTFMKVCKWDPHLCRFCTGHGIDLRKASNKRNINVAFLEEMQRLRTSCADLAVRGAYSTDGEDVVLDKKKRPRKAKISDKDIAPAVLNVTCPAFGRGDLVIEAMDIQMLFGVKNSDIWMQVLPKNLEYIRHGVLASLEDEKFGRRLQRQANGEELEEGEPQE
jgi:hypothetical protein